MNEIAISVGWAVCSTLLLAPEAACSEAGNAWFIGVAFSTAITALLVPISASGWRLMQRTRRRRRAKPPIPVAPLPDYRPTASARLAVELDRPALQRPRSTRPTIRSVQ
jgi:hypothetical protein